MFNEKQHANGAEAWIDATTKTDEPYNLAAGVVTIIAALTSAAATITFVATSVMLPVYILIGIATTAFVTAGVLRLVGNYKRNNEITDRMEQYRKEELDLANKQQQTPTKQPEVDEPEKENNKENGQENDKENGQENNKENGQENNMDNGQENNNENNIPPAMSPLTPPLQLNQFSQAENQEFPKRFDIKPPVAQQNMGNEGPNNSNSKNKPMKLNLADFLSALGNSKKKEITNKANTGLPPETQGRGINE